MISPAWGKGNCRGRISPAQLQYAAAEVTAAVAADKVVLYKLCDV
jgi:hypothetical protein